ncbi:MAG: hypothetical protein ABIV50_07190 [Opitutus sp.]
MSPSATPSAPAPSGDDRNLVVVDENYVAPTFEERLRIFWQKNSKVVTVVLIVVLLLIIGKGAWEYLAAQKEQDIEQAYGAATTPAQIKAFALANPQHSLAGVAHVRIGDDAYSEGRFSDAIGSYEQGIAILKSGPLASRARLGLAMAKLQSGRGADAEAALKAFGADSKEIKAYRAEAYYHLASLAVASGNAADLRTYSDQLMQLDPASPWTQRALTLRASLPGDAGTSTSGAMPAITLPGSSK